MADLLEIIAADHLPPLEPWSQLPLHARDTVIHAPGFEHRTLAITDSILPTNGTRAILLDYRPFKPENKLDEVRARLSESGIQMLDDDVVTYDRFEPADFESRLRGRLVSHGAQRVFVDISTMSKLAIMLVLNVCRELDLKVQILYAEAEHYAPTKDEFEAARKGDKIHRPTLQVFTGVHGVVRVASLASVAMQGQPTAALVFMSFNDALTQVLLDTVYPSRLLLINGRPPHEEWREIATAWIHDQVRREWGEDNPVRIATTTGELLPQRAVSTLDYRQTVTLLIRLYWELSSKHRILLAPAGSKMQAVGCYMAKALHPDIHIEYPSPEGFHSSYSFGVRERWKIDLGCLSERLSVISEAERNAYLEIKV